VGPQPSLCDRPFPFEGGGGDSNDFGGFFDRKSTKVAQFHNPFLLRVEGGEPAESVVNGQYVNVSRGRGRLVASQRYTLPPGAPLVRSSCSCPINKNSAHDLRGNTIEVRAILPADSPLIDQADVRFVNQRRWLQGMIRPFVPQTLSSDPSKLAVYQWQ